MFQNLQGLIPLTSNRDLQSDFIRILEISQHMFDEFCYDSNRNVIVDDADYYLIYFETFKRFLYQKKGRHYEYLLFDYKRF